MTTEPAFDTHRTLVLALVGPPCAGKSTAVSVLEDIGVPCRDTGDAIRAEAYDRFDGTGEPDEDYIWNVASLIREEHGPEGPTAINKDWLWEQRANGFEVLCVASCRDEAEIEWLREHIGTTLVVRIDADSHARSERYVEKHLEDDRDVVDKDRIYELREQLYEREYREMPYPEHDVVIRNEDSMSIRDLWRKLERVVAMMKA